MTYSLSRKRESWRPYIATAEDSIPTEQARILWNWNDKGRVRDVLIDVHPGVSGYVPEYSEEYMCSGGACYSDWLNPKEGVKDGFHPAAHFTPEGTFGSMVSSGFVDDHELRNAILQFARIERCVWAQAMLCSMFEEEVQRTAAEAIRRHIRSGGGDHALHA